MAFSFTRHDSLREHWGFFFLCVALCGGTVALALTATSPKMQLGGFSISGILAMGAWLRLRLILSPPKYQLYIDHERIEWGKTEKEECIFWNQITHLILTTGEEPFLHVQLHGGHHRYVATSCLPGDTTGLSLALEEEVLPHHPQIKFHQIKR